MGLLFVAQGNYISRNKIVNNWCAINLEFNLLTEISSNDILNNYWSFIIEKSFFVIFRKNNIVSTHTFGFVNFSIIFAPNNFWEKERFYEVRISIKGWFRWIVVFPLHKKRWDIDKNL